MHNSLYIQITLFSLVIFIATVASGHPGKTDYQDGHKCLKNCDEWDMHYKEYHLHDKDRNAIRMQGSKQSLREPVRTKKAGITSQKQEVAAVPVQVIPEPQTKESSAEAARVTVSQGYVMPVEEEGLLHLRDIILFSVAGLLWLVMIFIRKKREKDSSYSRFHAR